jgi:hypothetical protein
MTARQWKMKQEFNELVRLPMDIEAGSLRRRAPGLQLLTPPPHQSSGKLVPENCPAIGRLAVQRNYPTLLAYLVSSGKNTLIVVKQEIPYIRAKILEMSANQVSIAIIGR